MGPSGVRQLGVLADLFECALHLAGPVESVAIPGIAGGNGLDRVDPAVTKRVAGIDIHPGYLEAVRARYPDVELYCADLSRNPVLLPSPVALVHAALFFEHAGVDPALDHVLQMLAPGEGRLSVVLQLPSESAAAVSDTGYESIQRLKNVFRFVDPVAFREQMEQRGFTLEHESTHPLYGGKALWFAIFSRRR